MAKREKRHMRRSRVMGKCARENESRTAKIRRKHFSKSFRKYLRERNKTT